MLAPLILLYSRIEPLSLFIELINDSALPQPYITHPMEYGYDQLEMQLEWRGDVICTRHTR